MNSRLQNFLRLGGSIETINNGSFIYKVQLNEVNLPIIQDLFNNNYIEQVTDINDEIILLDSNSSEISTPVCIEFITGKCRNFGFYLSAQDFIVNNRFAVPNEYYINDNSSSSTSAAQPQIIEKYVAITNLIRKLIDRSKFVAEENVKILCLVHDNSFIEIPVDNHVYEEQLAYENVKLIKEYTENISSYKEKRAIFLKELILSLEPEIKTNRLKHLISNFSEFYEKCNTSFEYCRLP